MDTRLPGILGKDGEYPDSLEFLLGSCLGDKGQLSISWYGHVLDHWAPSMFFLLLKPGGCFLVESSNQTLPNHPVVAPSFLAGLHTFTAELPHLPISFL